MKSGRQKIIMDIISSKDIETQGQLLEELLKQGVSTTQATLSRDIKDMRLVKELTADGRYRYAPAGRPEADESLAKLKRIFKESVISFDLAQYIVVLHTLPGLANAACSALDNMNFPGVEGTIAGEDTAFIAMGDKEAAVRLMHEIENLLK